MRWFFFLLLLANVSFYYWRHMAEPVQPGTLVGAMAESEDELLLLSELERGAATRSSAPPEEAGQLSCWLRGPYQKVGPPRALAAESPLLELKAEAVGESVEYWVHQGPYSSYAEANQADGRLKKKGVDSFVIRRGELENAVSLGVFSDASRAETQAERLRKQGYSAEIRRLARTRYQYWVSLRGEAAEAAVEGARRQLFNKKNDGAAAEKKSCNVVASLNDFN